MIRSAVVEVLVLRQLLIYFAEDSTSVPDVNCLSKDPSVGSVPKFDKGWNTFSKFLRPRSFCLLHAVDTVELLQKKGGANILVICHSGMVGRDCFVIL